MKRKALIIGSVLAASLLLGSTAQADDDYGYLPYGFIGGLWLGLALDHDHYRDHRWHDYGYRHHPYPYRDYRWSDSRGYRHRDRHDHDKYKHNRDRDRDRWR